MNDFRTVDLIDTDNHTVKWIVDNKKEELLYVDNSFQRNYVWHKKHKVKLIETIILGYSIPEIYLWDTGTNPETGDTKYSIVDGQQRIGAIVDFVNNKYNLTASYLDDENADYAGKKFSELADKAKANIWGYRLFMRLMNRNMRREDIVETFLRLNATDKSLNPQELRNAEFNGEFLLASKEIADMPLWENYKVFSANDRRRMRDIEMISSLLLFLRFGIEHEMDQDSINKAYDLFNETYEEKEDDMAIFNTIMKELEKLMGYSENNARFIKRRTHLYTLFVYLYEKCILDDEELNSDDIETISSFIEVYQDGVEIRMFGKHKVEKIEEYRNFSRGGTTDKKSRLGRVQTFKEIIS